jgi:hypothetical protein
MSIVDSFISEGVGIWKEKNNIYFLWTIDNWTQLLIAQLIALLKADHTNLRNYILFNGENVRLYFVKILLKHVLNRYNMRCFFTKRLSIKHVTRFIV